MLLSSSISSSPALSSSSGDISPNMYPQLDTDNEQPPPLSAITMRPITLSTSSSSLHAQHTFPNNNNNNNNNNSNLNKVDSAINTNIPPPAASSPSSSL